MILRGMGFMSDPGKFWLYAASKVSRPLNKYMHMNSFVGWDEDEH